MKKVLLGLAFLCFMVTSSYATVTTLSDNTNTEFSVDGDNCDKCGKEKCDKKCSAEEKKACTSSKKACCAKKAEAKKACCSKDGAKKCSKADAKKDDKTKE